jgi:hypothetical protein
VLQNRYPTSLGPAIQIFYPVYIFWGLKTKTLRKGIEKMTPALYRSDEFIVSISMVLS